MLFRNRAKSNSPKIGPSNSYSDSRTMHEKKQRLTFTLSQALVLAGLCSCFSVVLTSYFHYFTYELTDAVHLVSASKVWEDNRRASVDTEPKLRKEMSDKEETSKEERDTDEPDDSSDDGSEENKRVEEEAPQKIKIVGLKTEDRVIIKLNASDIAHLRNTSTHPEIGVVRNGISRPNIAWLMSFPNSGTSFTLHMTREASNTTTATNYAMEGDVRDLASTQVIEGKAGENGPFLELIKNRYSNIPHTILTKTHCAGFCSLCGPRKLWFETPRTFLRGCLSGTRAVYGQNGLEEIDVIYDKSLVTKAIHIYRHPLDNIVGKSG
jgi:hypothetical protein